MPQAQFAKWWCKFLNSVVRKPSILDSGAVGVEAWERSNPKSEATGLKEGEKEKATKQWPRQETWGENRQQKSPPGSENSPISGKGKNLPN